MNKIRCQGFTLIELLVAMLILSIASVAAVKYSFGSFSSDEKLLEKIGQQLFNEMNFVLDEALIQQRLFGLKIDNAGINDNRLSQEENITYHWLYYNDNEQWQPVENGLDSTILPNEIRIEVLVDDELLDTLLEKTINEFDEDERQFPAIIFFPNNDVSDFNLHLKIENDDVVSTSDQSYRIFIDERGQLASVFTP